MKEQENNAFLDRSSEEFARRIGRKQEHRLPKYTRVWEGIAFNMTRRWVPCAVLAW